jgi:hypothetical protein
VTQLWHLHTVKTGSLNAAAYLHLSRLPHLEVLDGDVIEGVFSPPHNSPDAPRFPALRQLSLSAESITHVTNFMAQVDSAPLTAVGITTRSSSPGPDYRAFFSTLVSHCSSYLTSVRIHLDRTR